MTTQTQRIAKGRTRQLVSLSLLILVLGILLVLFMSLLLSLYWISAWSFTTLVFLFGIKFVYDDYADLLIMLEETEERLDSYGHEHFLSKGDKSSVNQDMD